MPVGVPAANLAHKDKKISAHEIFKRPRVVRFETMFGPTLGIRFTIEGPFASSTTRHTKEFSLGDILEEVTRLMSVGLSHRSLMLGGKKLCAALRDANLSYVDCVREDKVTLAYFNSKWGEITLTENAISQMLNSSLAQEWGIESPSSLRELLLNARNRCKVATYQPEASLEERLAA